MKKVANDEVLFNGIRRSFPVTEETIFLNNAAESPLYRPVRDKLDEYLEFSMRNPHKKPSIRDEIKVRLSSLFGGKPSDYSLVSSTGVGIGMVAAGFRWEKGDNVLIPEDEHWNNTFPWYHLASKGVEVRLVPVDKNGMFTIEDVAKMIDGRTRILSMAAVRYNSGFRPDLRAYSELAHMHGAFLVVDGIQAAGVIPMNVESDGIDVLCSAAFKWLYGFPGTGFMYVSDSFRKNMDAVLPGMFSAESDIENLNFFEDARRYETGSIAYPFYHAWQAGLDLIEHIGIENIHSRVLDLTDRIIEGLIQLGLVLATPIGDKNVRSAIVVFDTGNEMTNKDLFKYLLSKNIIISLRNGKCRVSPAMYNNFEEIDVFLRTIAEYLDC